MTAIDQSAASSSKALNISLWVVQALLGAAFLMAGFFKSTGPIEEIVKNMAWASALPVGLVRFIGVSELAGGIGVLLPSLTRIKPMLTPLAGVGLATIMLLAIPLHLTRAEWGAVPFNLVLGGLAAFVAWGRFQKAPIAPRK